FKSGQPMCYKTGQFYLLLTAFNSGDDLNIARSATDTTTSGYFGPPLEVLLQPVASLIRLTMEDSV
ncbi:MAG: hypothetical protein O7D86_01725, partial [Proteobacteria bacterium]|nr:hypothetical protein [Pseudomonadota bacterium]